ITLPPPSCGLPSRSLSSRLGAMPFMSTPATSTARPVAGPCLHAKRRRMVSCTMRRRTQPLRSGRIDLVVLGQAPGALRGAALTTIDLLLGVTPLHGGILQRKGLGGQTFLLDGRVAAGHDDILQVHLQVPHATAITVGTHQGDAHPAEGPDTATGLA